MNRYKIIYLARFLQPEHNVHYVGFCKLCKCSLTLIAALADCVTLGNNHQMCATHGIGSLCGVILPHSSLQILVIQPQWGVFEHWHPLYGVSQDLWSLPFPKHHRAPHRLKLERPNTGASKLVSGACW